MYRSIDTPRAQFLAFVNGQEFFSKSYISHAALVQMGKVRSDEIESNLIAERRLGRKNSRRKIFLTYDSLKSINSW